MKTMRKICLMTAAVAIVSVCHANIVSWNYNSWGDAYGTQSTDVAGLVSASYWNDTWLDGLTTDLLDNTGAATTIDISWESFNNWYIQGSHPGTDTDGSYNKEILNGYLNAGPAAWSPDPTYSAVTLSEIEYASYSIIVYFSSDLAGREGYVTDGSTTYYFNTVGPDSIASGNALFVQATDTTDAGYTVAANYAVFTGLSGATQTVTVQMRDDDEWGGIAAVQIVAGDPRAVQETDPYSSETDVAVDLSDRTYPNYLSWVASSDPNIAEVKGYDLFLDPNETKVSNRDADCLIVAEGMAASVTQYDPVSDFGYLTKYYWAVDTSLTLDDDPNLGTPTETIYAAPSLVWNFETVSAIPNIQTYDSVVVTESMLPATLLAVVTDADNNLSSAGFALLTDDVDYPNPGSYTLTPNVSDPYAPSCTFTADTPGFYKIKLTVSDGTNTVEDIAEIAIYDDPNACAAAQFNWQTWGGFNSMDLDQDCHVGLSDFAIFALQWLDDQSLTEPENYDWTIPYTPIVNGLVNGNFETGEFTDSWHYNSEQAVITDVDPIEGVYSAEWTVDTGDGDADGDGIAVYFTVEANTSYTVSTQIVGGSNNEDDEFLVRRQHDFDNPVVEATSWVPDAENVQTVTLSFTTGSDDEGEMYSFVIFGKTEGVYCKVDDLRLE